MSSNPVWKKDASGVEHPTHELILAFIRGQCSEHEKSRISGHLHAGCVPCNGLHAGLTQESATLNQLKHISRYLYYPELQSNKILLHAQRGEALTSVWTGKRKRKFQVQSRQQITRGYAHKGSVRIISLPAAFALLLLFMTAVLVLAYTVVNSRLHIPLPGQPTNSIHSDSGPNATSIAEHLPTPTNTVAVTMTPTVSATPTTTIIKGAGLDACPPDQYVGPVIFICGYGFKAGDKVWLEVENYGSNSLKTLGPYLIHQDGKFKAYWSVSCKNLPVTVYAADKMQQPLTVPLMNISRYGCFWPTPTATSGGH